MTSLNHLPAALVMAPLAGAALTFVTRRRWDPAIALVTGVTILGMTLALAASVLREGAFRYPLGGWGAPLGIDLVADGSAALFLVLTAIVGLAVTAYASSYIGAGEEDAYGRGLFWALWLFMWASLNALFLTGDVFNVYVCLELVGISAVALVTLGGGAEALRAGARYLFASMLGAMTYLLGVALLYASTGGLDMAILSGTLRGDLASKTGLVLMVAALALKTALVPAHFWLPSAHAAAPAPVSAALSALVVKGSYFALLRLMLDVMPSGYLPGLDVGLAVLGSVAIVWGSTQALLQVRVKQLVAYSTVAQVGYLFIVFPLARSGRDVLALALTGVLAHAAAHALAKSGLFLSAGSLISRFGSDDISGLAGAARTAPALAMTVAAAGVTMMGLPPSGGFSAKWVLVSAALAARQWWWAAVMILGGLLAAAYSFRLIAVLIAEGNARPAEARHALRTEWVPLALAGAALLLVFAMPLVETLARASITIGGPVMLP